jgi:hypothetical protein
VKVLKDLLLALLNATVLLLIGLGVVAIILVNRTDRLAHDVIDGIAPVGDSLEEIAEAIGGIEDRLEAEPAGALADAALVAEIAALRAELAALRAPVDALGGLSAEGIVAAVMDRIDGGAVAAP